VSWFTPAGYGPERPRFRRPKRRYRRGGVFPTDAWRAVFLDYDPEGDKVPACAADNAPLASDMMSSLDPRDHHLAIDRWCSVCPIREACAEIRANDSRFNLTGMVWGGIAPFDASGWAEEPQP
jgi:hypothetical protein